jgi:hypothetical protein
LHIESDLITGIVPSVIRVVDPKGEKSDA